MCGGSDWGQFLVVPPRGGKKLGQGASQKAPKDCFGPRWFKAFRKWTHYPISWSVVDGMLVTKWILYVKICYHRIKTCKRLWWWPVRYTVRSTYVRRAKGSLVLKAKVRPLPRASTPYMRSSLCPLLRLSPSGFLFFSLNCLKTLLPFSLCRVLPIMQSFFSPQCQWSLSDEAGRAAIHAVFKNTDTEKWLISV